MNNYLLLLASAFVIPLSGQAQRFDPSVTWDCQYIMGKDSAGNAVIEKMKDVVALRFVSDSALTISGICNSGEARLKHGKDSLLKITDISKTMLWCDQKVKEDYFFRFLALVSAYEMNSAGLKLYINNRKDHLFFVRH